MIVESTKLVLLGAQNTHARAGKVLDARVAVSCPSFLSIARVHERLGTTPALHICLA